MSERRSLQPSVQDAAPSAERGASERAALEAEIRALRDQVKTLVRMESKLHMAQRRLDAQIALFRRLNELAQGTNASVDLMAILRTIAAFAMEQLNYQRCAILLRDRDAGCYFVLAHAGYFGTRWDEALASILLTADDPLMVAVREQKKVVFRDDVPNPASFAAAEALGMDRFLAFPIETGNEQLVGLLIAGATRDEEQFYVRVDGEGDAAQGLANLAGQTSAAIQKCYLFGALEAERNQLDENVRRRTLELSEAYANLAKVDSLKTKFFANISHEIRTPLTLSIGPTELLLRDRALSEEFKVPLRSVHTNQVRLLKLINDLLDFSKLEAGQMSTRFAPVDVVTTIRGQLAMLEGAAAARSIVIEKDFPEEGVEVYLDAGKFDKILLNLLSNAFKFTPNGGRIGVRVEQAAEAVRIYVSDTGIGIPEDAQARIFDRFYQVHGSDTRAYAGTGIGLAMVKEFTELHGGTVAVESALGAGSTFTLTFRRGRDHLDDDDIDADAATLAALSIDQFVEFAAADDECVDDQLPESIARAPQGQSASGAALAPEVESFDVRPEILPQEATVLVVDDTPDMRKFLASVLRPHYRVRMARDGVDAMEKLQEHVPDIIISDVMMPRMSGRDLCAAVKASPGALGRTPVVLVTAKAEMAMKLDGLSSGADDYLVKPFDADELLCRVKNLVTVRRQEKLLAEVVRDLRAKDARLQHDLAEAQSFQQRLLPKLPVTERASFAAVYRPLDMVGGDFYDVSEIAPGHYRIFVADVTGHGVQASLRTMMLKGELERIRDSVRSPEELLAALNRRLVANYLPLELLCAACCVDLELKPGVGARARIASAAHPPLIHVSRDGFQELHGGGPLLGTYRAEIDVPVQELSLKPREMLAIFTDGLCEQPRPDGQFFDSARIGGALVRREGNLEQALSQLMARFDAFRESRAVTDDVTVMAVEIT